MALMGISWNGVGQVRISPMGAKINQETYLGSCEIHTSKTVLTFPGRKTKATYSRKITHSPMRRHGAGLRI